MTHDEVLEQEALESGIELIDRYNFKSPRIKGLYCNNVIALSGQIKTKSERGCILAEELGRHFTTVGNIIAQDNIENRKQEYKARVWAYNKLIGLSGIIKAYEHRCCNKADMADYLDVTEEFLDEALHAYKNKYGECVVVGNYIIYFEPYFGVLMKL